MSLLSFGSLNIFLYAKSYSKLSACKLYMVHIKALRYKCESWSSDYSLLVYCRGSKTLPPICIGGPVLPQFSFYSTTIYSFPAGPKLAVWSWCVPAFWALLQTRLIIPCRTWWFSLVFFESRFFPCIVVVNAEIGRYRLIHEFTRHRVAQIVPIKVTTIMLLMTCSTRYFTFGSSIEVYDNTLLSFRARSGIELIN